MRGSTKSRSSGRRDGWAKQEPPPAGEEPPTADREVWSRCHCPVCGHQDRVTMTARTAIIRCSHCDTLLEVTLPTPTSESVSVRVAVDVPES